MTKQLMMYEKLVPLNSILHRDLYVKIGKDFNHAREMGAIPVVLSEFPLVAQEYAIVFAGTEKEVTPVVITSVNHNENIYVGDQNQWKARYIPAFVRRYPFVFSASDDKSKLTMCIDESYAGVNREGKGERLFDADGEQTQFLKNSLVFLESYQSHFRHTQLFCQKLVELDLLQDMTANVTIGGQKPKTLYGFKGVDRNKLKALSADTLAELHRKDWLELIHIHLLSIRNFGAAIEKVVPAPEEDQKSAAEEKV